MITIPEKKIAVIDQLDRGMDMLNGLWFALQTRGDLEYDDIKQLSNVLCIAIETLKPVRSAVYKAHGESWI